MGLVKKKKYKYINLGAKGEEKKKRLTTISVSKKKNLVDFLILHYGEFF